MKIRIISLLWIVLSLSACGGGSSAPDADNDGVADTTDNCVNEANANQADSDGDGIGDICDAVFDLGDSLGLAPTDIELDPFRTALNTAPLSAQLSFTAPIPGTVTITVLGKNPDGIKDCDGSIDISHQFNQSATNFVLPVLGLYPEYVNTVIVDFAADDGQTTRDTLSVATGPLPEVDSGGFVLPVEVEIIQNNLPADDAGLFLFTQQKSAFDQCGEIRWQYLGEGWQFYRILDNGNWLGSLNENAIVYHYPKFAEFTMLGEKVREYTVENYLHHDIRKLPWGNYLVATNFAIPAENLEHNFMTEEDVVVEISADTGQVVKTWDFNDILDPDRSPIPSNAREDDWLHNNAVVYDPADDSIIITAQRQSLVAKIDYETGNLRWILGSHKEWLKPEHVNKLLKPVDNQGDEVDMPDVDFWPYGPHAGWPLDGGRILVFDNGFARGWYETDQVPDVSDSYSRGIEYVVDEADMTVRIAWQYDHPDPSDPGGKLFTRFTGDIDYLENGHYLLGFAWSDQGDPDPDTPRVVEIDAAGNILFEAVSNRGQAEYRAEKFNVYHGQ